MKQIFLGILFIAFLVNVAIAQPSISILKNDEKSTIVQIKFAPIQADFNEVLPAIKIKGCTPWQQKGAPNLPKYTFSVQIPDAKDGVISIIDKQYISKQNVQILPSKGVQSRLIDIEKLPYENGTEYTSNANYPAQIAIANTPYIIRDVRGQAIHVSPVQYNAVTKELIAYQSITMEIKYIGTSTENVILRNEEPSSINETFYQIYNNHFVNYGAKKKTRATPFLENDKLIVMCPQKFIASILPFVEWKKRKGIYTKLVNVDTLTGGVTQATIFNFIKNYYLDNAISHVLMVGDESDIPVLDGGTIFSLGSDNPYGYMAGGDHYAEILVGRFTGANAQDIANQVSKSIAYEKTPNMDNKWYSRCVGIASNDPSNGDDNQFDWEHQREICDSLVTQGPFEEKLEFFDGDKGGKDEIGNPNAATLIDSMNNFGVGCINYSGHGSTGGIVTTQFTTNEVLQMHNNTGKWPFVLIVGCSPGYFLSPSICFAEALMQSTDSTGKQIGTCINAMSTVPQWWEDPMEAQDEFNNILCDARPYAIKHSFAGMLVNGFFSMNDKYDVPAYPLSGSKMTDTWQIFGDPTLVVKTNDSGKIEITNNKAIPVGASTYSLTCNTNDADVCLYQNGEILATTKSAYGVANFTFAPTTDTNTIYLTATKYNFQPFVGTTTTITSINNEVLNNAFSIYPNPATSQIVINSSVSFDDVTLLNQVGEIVSVYQNNNTKKCKLFVQNLANGLYFVKINTKQGVVIKKIVKQ